MTTTSTRTPSVTSSGEARATTSAARSPRRSTGPGGDGGALQQVHVERRARRDVDGQPPADEQVRHRDSHGREALRHAPHGEVAGLDPPAGRERRARDEHLDRRADLLAQRPLAPGDVRRGQRPEHEREAEQQRRPPAAGHGASGSSSTSRVPPVAGSDASRPP